jgi:hypothetical protein
MGRLAELVQTGSNVPRAFAVTVDAFRDHMVQSGLDELIARSQHWILTTGSQLRPSPIGCEA